MDVDPVYGLMLLAGSFTLAALGATVYWSLRGDPLVSVGFLITTLNGIATALAYADLRGWLPRSQVARELDEERED